MTLEQLVKNYFENIKVSIVRKEMFVHNHLQRMKSDTLNGQLDVVIGETEPKYVLLKANSGLRKTIMGTGKGSTMIINAINDKFIVDVRELETMTKLKFKKESPQYVEVFLRGLTEYQTADLSEIPSLLTRLITFTEKYKTELGAEYLTKFKDIEVEWKKENGNREDIIQETKNTRPDLNSIWKNLSKQLQRNSYTILLASPDNPEKLYTYFDFNIVNSRHHKKSDGTADASYLLSIAPSISKTADFSFSPTDTLLIMNNSTISIFFYAAPTPDAAQPTQLTEIAAGDELEITATQLGAPANKQLIFVNKDATERADVEIALI